MSLTLQTFNDVAVVGMHFRELDGIPAKSIVSSFVPPVQLDLVREPENPYDSYAIKVMYGGEHIGYIEAKQAMWIAPRMDDGTPYCAIVEYMEERKNNLHPICRVQPLDS